MMGIIYYLWTKSNSEIHRYLSLDPKQVEDVVR
jgi:hypothetical protein